MTSEEIQAIKARLGSLNPRKLADLRSWSEACWKLLTVDLPKLLEYTERTTNARSDDERVLRQPKM
jgi:hypothetical protein